MEEKTLSRCIDLTDFDPQKLNLVCCSCGAGKTYFALHKLPLLTNTDFMLALEISKCGADEDDEAAFEKLLDEQDIDKINADDPLGEFADDINIDWDMPDDQYLKRVQAEWSSHRKRILYLIDTIAGRDQIIMKNKICAEYEYAWRERLPHELWGEVDTHIVVMTYAKFGALCKYSPKWFYDLNIIICDEIHNLYRYAQIDRANESAGRKTPMLNNIAKEALLCTLFFRGDIYIVGLTATPEIILEEADWYNSKTSLINYIPIHGKTREYSIAQEEEFSNLQYLCTQLPCDKKGIIYTPRISTIEKCLKILQDRGIKAQAIWSMYNSEHPMSDEQKKLRNTILFTEHIPDDIQVLLINKSCETSINIFGHVDYMVINSTVEDEIIQARGRYRGDLDLCYFRREDDASIFFDEILIPEKYLNRPLIKKEIQEIINSLHLLDSSKRPMKPPTFIKIAKSSGYNVRSGKRINNQRTTVFKINED